MKYVRMYADQSGDSHFEDAEIEMQPANYAPPAPPLDLSPLMAGSVVGFLGAPSGWYGEPHPTPRRQFLCFLTGEMDVTVSDGEVRHFAPGSIILMEDTTGKGHATRVVSKDYVLMAILGLGDS